MMQARLLILATLFIVFSNCTVHNVYFSNGCNGANEIGATGAPVPQACSIVAGTVDDVTNLFNGLFRWDLGGDTVTEGHIHYNGTVTQNSALKDILWASVPMGATQMQVTNFTLTAQAVQDMIATPSRAYFNLHSTAYPNGAARGQITTAARPSFNVFFMNGCTGKNEVGVTGSPSGSWCGESSLTVSSTGILSGSINWDLPGDTIVAAHIHLGADKSAASGTIYILFADSNQASPFSIVNFQLNDTAISDIELGHAYLNLHSVSKPDGAVRAQLHSTANAPRRNWVPVYFQAGCNGANEVAPTVGSPTATCMLQYGQIDDADNHFSGDLTNTMSDTTDVHIYVGANAAQNGVNKVVLYQGAATAVPFTFEGVSLNASTITDIKNGNAYFNVPTTALPAGAVRGQLTLQRTNFVVVPMTPCPTLEICDFESTAVFDALRNISGHEVTVFRVENPAGWMHTMGTTSAGYFRFILNNIAKPVSPEPPNSISWKLYDGPIVNAACTNDFTCSSTTQAALCNLPTRIGVDSSNYCIQDDAGPWHVVVTNTNADKSDIEVQVEFELFNNAVCAVASVDCTLRENSSASLFGLSMVTFALSTLLSLALL